MATPNFLKNVNESVDRYAEQWQESHVHAMECLDVEESLAFGIWVRTLIDRVAQIWRSNVQKNPGIYNPAVDDAIERLYRSWLVPCPRAFEKISALEKQGFDVAGANEFRATCRDVERTVKLSEGLRIGKEQLDRGERVPFSEVQKRAMAK